MDDIFPGMKQEADGGNARDEAAGVDQGTATPTGAPASDMEPGDAEEPGMAYGDDVWNNEADEAMEEQPVETYGEQADEGLQDVDNEERQLAAEGTEVAEDAEDADVIDMQGFDGAYIYGAASQPKRVSFQEPVDAPPAKRAKAGCLKHHPYQMANSSGQALPPQDPPGRNLLIWPVVAAPSDHP